MHYLKYSEDILHRTGELPLAFYHVDERHPRYHMRMHWHRETELLWMRRGKLALYIDDQLTQLSEGDLVALGDGVLHGGEPQDAVYDCIVLDPYALLMHIAPCKEALRAVCGRTLRIERQDVDFPLRAALERLYGAAANVQGRELLLMGALYEVFHHLTQRAPQAVILENAHSGAKVELLKPALEYIENNYASHISLDALARLTGLSPKYFCRCFRAIVHRSPIEYLNHYRIECASFLLTTTEMSVAEVAQRCGYNDSSFFIKQFKRYKSTTPYQYRAHPRESANESFRFSDDSSKADV